MEGQVELVLLDPGAMNGSCTSLSDPANNIQCYGVMYTPGSSGTLTSYDVALIGNCDASGSNFSMPGSMSCVMADNTDIQDFCTSGSLFLLNLSGNTGNLSVTSGQTIMVHQFCFQLEQGESTTLVEDDVSGINFAITGPGGEPITDQPTYQPTTIQYVAPDDPCLLKVCDISFRSDSMRVKVDTLSNGCIVEGTSRGSSALVNQAFDVYDEINEACDSAGGSADLFISIELINTIDINSNGLIDSLGGSMHKILQDTNGLKASIPFNRDADSESSAGDVRGYCIKVDFADHVGIIADQLTVHMDSINSAGKVFESAALIFYDEFRQPYGTANYMGYYRGENDLSGACNPSVAGAAWDVTGNGVVVFQDDQVIDDIMPCDPGEGVDGVNNNASVHARIDAGLDSMDVISGFKLIVYGEDIASPNQEDLGNGNAPDDNIRANHKTSSEALLCSALKGYTVRGCIFQELILPVQWLNFSAELKNQEVLLEWETSKEVNNDFYEVQWSRDGVSYESIGIRPAERSPAQIQSYSFIHNNPVIGQNYYRIKQVDLDGSFSYSKVVSVTRNQGEVKVFPNPLTDRLTILTESLDDPIEVRVVSNSGIVVKQAILVGNEMNLADLDAGVYSVIVLQSQRLSIHKIVKI